MLKIAQYSLALAIVLACSFFYGWVFYNMLWRVLQF